MERDYSLSNLFKNTTKGQKIGVGLFLLIVVVLIMVLVSLLSDSLTTSGESEEVEQTEESTEEVVEEQYVNNQGYTVTKKTTAYPNGEVSVEETKMDEYGNVTTIDPSLITTYFPYQVMREHKEDDPTTRYFVETDEKEKIIRAYIEYCDEAQDKNLVYEYINSIPLDLSDYTVEFVINETYIYCGE